MRLDRLRGGAPWIVGLFALGALLLGGLPVLAAAVGAGLLLALGLRGLRRAGHLAIASTARTTLGLAALCWALVAMVAIVAVAGTPPRRGDPAPALSAEPILARSVHPLAALVELLLAAAAVSSGFAIRALGRPVRPGAPAGESALRMARAILAEHGTDSLAPFAVRPDKSLAFAGGAVVAYRVIGNTVVVSADPIGPPGSTVAALAALLEATRRAHMHLVLYGAGERELDGYRELGLHVLQVGEEAVVDPCQFTLDGRPVRKLRQSVNRVQRRGWQLSTVRGRDLDEPLEREIERVERRWRAGQTHVRGFAMSYGDQEPEVRPDDLYVLARAPEGELRAVMRFIEHRGKLSLDVMRRVGETPNGLNEALICDALAVAREAGVPEVSLNYAGLAHLIRGGPTGGRLRRGTTAVLLAACSRFFQMDRLVLFNEKFSPQWRARHLVYDGRLALPVGLLRVLQAEGYLPERRRARSARTHAGDETTPDALAGCER